MHARMYAYKVLYSTVRILPLDVSTFRVCLLGLGLGEERIGRGIELQMQKDQDSGFRILCCIVPYSILDHCDSQLFLIWIWKSYSNCTQDGFYTCIFY
jgi:hypothetical protein